MKTILQLGLAALAIGGTGLLAVLLVFEVATHRSYASLWYIFCGVFLAAGLITGAIASERRVRRLMLVALVSLLAGAMVGVLFTLASFLLNGA